MGTPLHCPSSVSAPTETLGILPSLVLILSYRTSSCKREHHPQSHPAGQWHLFCLSLKEKKKGGGEESNVGFSLLQCFGVLDLFEWFMAALWCRKETNEHFSLENVARNFLPTLFFFFCCKSFSVEKGKHTETAGAEHWEDPDSLLCILQSADSHVQMHGTAIRQQTNKKNMF